MCKFVPKTVYVNVYKHKIILVSVFKIWYGFKIDILIYTTLVIITIKFYGHILPPGGKWSGWLPQWDPDNFPFSTISNGIQNSKMCVALAECALTSHHDG